MASNSHRMVIIGLDGMPYRLIKDLAESGVMLDTRAIIKNGVFSQMESSIPDISSVAWSHFWQIFYVLRQLLKLHTRIESLENSGA